AVSRLAPAEAAAFGRLAVTGGHRVLLALSLPRRFGAAVPSHRVGFRGLITAGARSTDCRCLPRARACCPGGACGGQLLILQLLATALLDLRPDKPPQQDRGDDAEGDPLDAIGKVRPGLDLGQRNRMRRDPFIPGAICDGL